MSAIAQEFRTPVIGCLRRQTCQVRQRRHRACAAGSYREIGHAGESIASHGWHAERCWREPATHGPGHCYNGAALSRRHRQSTGGASGTRLAESVAPANP
jgi:hypothetical protein